MLLGGRGVSVFLVFLEGTEHRRESPVICRTLAVQIKNKRIKKRKRMKRKKRKKKMTTRTEGGEREKRDCG